MTVLFFMSENVWLRGLTWPYMLHCLKFLLILLQQLRHLGKKLHLRVLINTYTFPKRNGRLKDTYTLGLIDVITCKKKNYAFPPSKNIFPF